jgi:hypothetical protein
VLQHRTPSVQQRDPKRIKLDMFYVIEFEK